MGIHKIHLSICIICLFWFVLSPRALTWGTKKFNAHWKRDWVTPWKKWLLCWKESFLHTSENTLQILFLCPTPHKQKFHWNLLKRLLTVDQHYFNIFHKHLSTLPIWTTTHVLFWIHIGSFCWGNTTRTWFRRWLSIYPAWSS